MHTDCAPVVFELLIDGDGCETEGIAIYCPRSPFNDLSMSSAWLPMSSFSAQLRSGSCETAEPGVKPLATATSKSSASLPNHQVLPHTSTCYIMYLIFFETWHLHLLCLFFPPHLLAVLALLDPPPFHHSGC